MKKVALAGAAVLALLLVAGGGVGLRQTLEPSSCEKPVVLFQSSTDAAIAATDDYIDANIAERYKHPATIDWITSSAKTSPTTITARIALGETEDGFLGFVFVGEIRFYSVVLERDCVGGDWKVTKFELTKDSPPEPLAGGGVSKASQTT